MTAQLRSELLKQRTTRTTWLLLAWLVGLVLIVVALHVASFGAGDYAQLLAGGALGGALFGALGVGVGALVRTQAAAVAALCVWLLLLEPLLLGDLPGAAKYAPEASAGAIAGAIQSQLAEALVAPALGVLLLAAYVTVAAVASALALNRRDVN